MSHGQETRIDKRGYLHSPNSRATFHSTLCCINCSFHEKQAWHERVTILSRTAIIQMITKKNVVPCRPAFKQISSWWRVRPLKIIPNATARCLYKISCKWSSRYTAIYILRSHFMDARAVSMLCIYLSLNHSSQHPINTDTFAYMLRVRCFFFWCKQVRL